MQYRWWGVFQIQSSGFGFVRGDVVGNVATAQIQTCAKEFAAASDDDGAYVGIGISLWSSSLSRLSMLPEMVFC